MKDFVYSREILEEVASRFNQANKGKTPKKKKTSKHKRTFNFKLTLFPEQLAFINDPRKRKAAMCSRRAGKTFAASRYLLQEAIDKPNTMMAYITRTRESAKRIIWNTLKQANETYRLHMHFNNAELIARFPNGSEIILTGANDASDVDKLRGAAFSLIVLDEAAFFNIDLRELVREVLTPCLLDVDGTLAMISTPNRQCAGLFYDITEHKKYNFSIHRWTILDNPYMKPAITAINRDIESGVLDPSEPAYMREYKGIWVRDSQSMVYNYTDHNVFETLPTDCFWEYILGIDLGYNDPTAFVVGAFSEDTKALYFFDSYRQSNMILSDVEDMIRKYQERYKFSTIVMDTGGGGSKMLMETIKQRSGLPIKAANKPGDKVGLIKMMNGDLSRGLIKVKRDSQILEEWDHLQFNLAGTSEDRRHSNHLSDAALYIWTESRHYLFEEKTVEPLPGSAAYFKQIEDGIEERLLLEQELGQEMDPDLWGHGYSDSECFGLTH